MEILQFRDLWAPNPQPLSLASVDPKHGPFHPDPLVSRHKDKKMTDVQLGTISIVNLLHPMLMDDPLQ